MTRKKLTIGFCRKVANAKKINCLEADYLNSSAKMRWQCWACNFTWSTSFGNLYYGGTGCPSCCVEKRKMTCLKKYGHTTNLNIKKLREKTVSSRTVCIEKIKEKLKFLYGDKITIDPETYINTQKKARFVDKDYGEWWATPNKVIDAKRGHPKGGKEKARKTMLSRYGVEHSMFSPELRISALRSQNRTFKLKHWFSQEEILCVASYEKKVVEYFNKNKIDYLWQVKHFLMPNGNFYIPDCYLPNEDKWIEIKGYFRKDAKKKWSWFHKNYPNSELWDKEKLEEMGII